MNAEQYHNPLVTQVTPLGSKPEDAIWHGKRHLAQTLHTETPDNVYSKNQFELLAEENQSDVEENLTPAMRMHIPACPATPLFSTNTVSPEWTNFDFPYIPPFPTLCPAIALELKYRNSHLSVTKYTKFNPPKDLNTKPRSCYFDRSDPVRYNKRIYISSEPDSLHDKNFRFGATEVRYYVENENTLQVGCYYLSSDFLPAVRDIWKK